MDAYHEDDDIDGGGIVDSVSVDREEQRVVAHVDNTTLLVGLLTSNFEDLKVAYGQVAGLLSQIVERVEEAETARVNRYDEEGRLALFRARCAALREVMGGPLSEEAALKVFMGVFEGPKTENHTPPPRADLESVRQNMAQLATIEGTQAIIQRGPGSYGPPLLGGGPFGLNLAGLGMAYGATHMGGR